MRRSVLAKADGIRIQDWRAFNDRRRGEDQGGDANQADII